MGSFNTPPLEESVFRIANALEIIAVQGFDKVHSTCKTEDDIYEYFRSLRVSNLKMLEREDLYNNDD